MDIKSKVNEINAVVNNGLSVLDDPIISNIVKVLIYMYIAQTTISNPVVTNAFNHLGVKVLVLTIALWYSNKNIVLSTLVSASVIVGITLATGGKLKF